MNISEQIETSFGDGPSHRPLEDRLSAGRRARRRRKSTEGLAVVAGVAVLGLAAYTLAPSGSPDTAKDPGFANPSTATPTDPSVLERLAALEASKWATYDPDGNVVLGEGVTERRRVPNPLNSPLPEKSVGLELERNGERLWMLLEYEIRDGDGVSSYVPEPAQKSFETLEQWLDTQGARQEAREQQRPSSAVDDDFAGSEGLR